MTYLYPAKAPAVSQDGAGSHVESSSPGSEVSSASSNRFAVLALDKESAPTSGRKSDPSPFPTLTIRSPAKQRRREGEDGQNAGQGIIEEAPISQNSGPKAMADTDIADLPVNEQLAQSSIK